MFGEAFPAQHPISISKKDSSTTKTSFGNAKPHEIQNLTARICQDCINLPTSDTIQTLPDILRHHPDTEKHPHTPSRHPHIRPTIAECHDIYLTAFDSYYIYPPQTSARHDQTPPRHCQTHSDTIQIQQDNYNERLSKINSLSKNIFKKK